MTDRSRDAGAWQDPIVAEVRAVRQALFAAAGYDIREFCRRLHEEQATSGHRVVTLASPNTSNKPEDAA